MCIRDSYYSEGGAINIGCAKLKFDYGGQLISEEDNPSFVTLYDGKDVKKFNRQEDLEQGFKSDLQKYGFVVMSKYSQKYRLNSKASWSDLTMNVGQNNLGSEKFNQKWEDFLARDIKKIRKLGWQVKIEEDFHPILKSRIFAQYLLTDDNDIIHKLANYHKTYQMKGYLEIEYLFEIIFTSIITRKFEVMKWIIEKVKEEEDYKLSLIHI